MEIIPVDPEDIIIAKGKHLPLVTQEIFDRAQEKMDNNPRSQWDAPLKNPLAGLIYCKHCGKAMAQRPYQKARTRIECRNRNGCGAKSAPLEEVVDAVVFALEQEQLPELEAKLKNNDGSSYVIQQRQLKKMREDLDELKQQETRQYIFLEKGIYTEDVFQSRNKALHVEMDELKTKIFHASKVLPKEIDYAEKIIRLKDAIAAMRDDNISIKAKNQMLKKIIQRIDYEFLGREGKGKTRYCLHIQLLL